MECFLIIVVFVLGYLAIILEYYIKVNKTAIALFIGAICWTIYMSCKGSANLYDLGHHVSEISQIIFFLIGAMTLVELIDSHRGFKMITNRLRTRSKRKMLWMIALASFFLSAVLDNLTTTILIVSLLRKLIPDREERFLIVCIVIVSANAGGAWTPIGDVTTTMLWINGQVSSFAVIKALIIPSIVSLLIPLIWYSLKLKGKFSSADLQKVEDAEPGAKIVFYLGIGGLVFVPIFKALTGLPPFMGVILALALLWIVTDLMHYPHEERKHLRVPHVLTRVDTSGVLFFLGILLSVAALQSAGMLKTIAEWLNQTVNNPVLIATLLGIFSAIIDNVPLVAATMGMYSLEVFPMDSSFWHMIAYAAGTGGSILIIGSSAGVAVMGIEKIDFLSYAKKISIPVGIGYLTGMGVYLML